MKFLLGLALLFQFQPIVSYTVTFYNSVNQVLLKVDFLGETTNCDYLETKPVIQGIINPDHVVWTNPIDPTRWCIADITSSVVALPDGSGYRTTVHINTKDDITPESPFSDNTFTKMTPRAEPLPPIPTRIILVTQ